MAPTMERLMITILLLVVTSSSGFSGASVIHTDTDSFFWATVDSTEIHIYSPGNNETHRSNYTANLTIEYYIEAANPHHTLEFTIYEFSLEEYKTDECRYDRLTIYDGYNDSFPILKRLCGDLSAGKKFYSTSDVVYLVFHSDYYLNYPGFDIGVQSYAPPTTTSTTTTTTATESTPTTSTKSTIATTKQTNTQTPTAMGSTSCGNKGYRLEDAITVQCTENGWDIVIDMHKLRLVYPGAVASDIYLGENTCTGSSSWNTLSFHHGLHECLTQRMIRNNNLVYRNELLYAERDPAHPFIVNHFNWTVTVDCDLQRNETSSGYIQHDKGQQPIVGSMHYSVNMSFYSDPNYMNPIQGNPVHVTYGSDVYVKVYTEAPDWSVKMKVTDCYTRPTPTSPDNLKYDLISNGCEMDTNTHIISQSTHETRFMFQDFGYISHHNGVYVYCDAIFCRNDDYSSSCTQACTP